MKALHPAQKDFHSFFMQAPVPMVMLEGPEHRIALANPYFAEIFGTNRMGMTLDEAFPAKLAALFTGLVEEVYATGSARSRKEFSLAGTPETWIDIACHPFKDSQGNLVGAIGIATDVTEQVTEKQKRQTSEAQLRLVADFSPVLMAYVDREEKYQFMNHLYKEWFDFEPSLSIGKTIREVVGPAAYAKAASRIELALRGEAVHFELFVTLKDGSRKDIDLQFVPFRPSSSEETNGFVILGYDLTDRKRAESALRLSESRYRDAQEHLKLALEGAQMSSWHVDLGTSPVPSPILQIHVDDASENAKAMLEAVKNRTVYNQEFRIVQNDGTIGWVVARGSTSYDESGRPLSMSGVLSNVTERRQVEHQFRAITELSPQFVWMSDEKGAITYSNSTLLKFMGLTDQDTSGDQWVNVLHPEDRERAVQVWAAALASGQPYEVEFRIRSKSGAYNWFLNRALPLRDQVTGRIESWLGVSTDITELKLVQASLSSAKEAAEKANQSKTAFLANISHEIRTPMTAVLGFAEILRDGHLSEEDRQDALHRIHRSGHALLKLIDDILDISKIEAGRFAPEKSRFSPLEVINEVVGLLKLQAQRKSLELKTRFASTTPHLAHSDAARVRQIITNLLSNAIKFTASGEVAVEVGGEEDHVAQKRYLVFEVSDTGIGIAPSDQEKLFQPFAQADDSISRKFGGTGLGLLLSRRLCQLLGGDLHLIESQVQKGSRFRAKIEAGYCESLPPEFCEGWDVQEGAGPAFSLDGVRVLVVDDAVDNQVLLRFYLESAGIEVEVANHADEAIKKALSQNFHVVLMDIQMPDIDGLEAARRLRAQGYKSPILALTAHAMDDEASRSLNAGCDEHLTKPINKQRLLETIHRYAVV